MLQRWNTNSAKEIQELKKRITELEREILKWLSLSRLKNRESTATLIDAHSDIIFIRKACKMCFYRVFILLEFIL